jgi:hypothetical protein
MPAGGGRNHGIMMKVKDAFNYYMNACNGGIDTINQEGFSA